VVNEVEIVRLYCEEMLTPKSIGEKLECSATTVVKCLKRQGVSIRGREEAQRLAISLGRKNYYRGDACHQWKGGRFVNKEGYVWVKLQPNEQRFAPMANHRGYVREHRLVLAKSLGRCLESWEVVHHKNGVKNDNRIDNLKLLPNRNYHQSDLVLKSRLKQLECKVKEQDKELRLLKWQLIELRKEVRDGGLRYSA